MDISLAPTLYYLKTRNETIQLYKTTIHSLCVAKVYFVVAVDDDGNNTALLLLFILIGLHIIFKYEYNIITILITN